MIRKIKSLLKSYDLLSENSKRVRGSGSGFEIIDLKNNIQMDVAYDCLTNEEYVETIKILEAIQELIEKEDDIKEFFEKSNNQLKESFYTFYQAYSELRNNTSESNKPAFKNFLFNLYEETK